ncbi:oligosaccharide flippase family protein [Clostridium sp. SHJSY1]|uniref:oligosaccharide flippase family protein n=1 Tax=Clostridium sp. SHJSY1 TaxID=2942483 RepID=UPI002875CA7D|nr:oligosaccharide flippase family protein [Clostridium sp. SHJSY1]MDS0526640.1 oligosaccharide flippase family protein [Clostridium sp. SHJSY1]
MKKSFIKSTFIYTVVKYAALILGFLRELINARQLGPETFGVLGNLLLILSYFLYANFGTIYAMTKECSILEKNKEKVNKIINGTFSFLVILSGLFLIGGMVYLNIYKYSPMGVYIFLVCLIAIFDQFRLYFTNYFRVKDNLRQINNIELIYHSLSAVLTVLLISKWGIYGALIALLIADIVTFISCVKRVENLRLVADKEVFIRLISVGIPLLIYNLGFYILTTIDRMFIIKFLSKEELGYYTFASQIAKATLMFLNSVLFIYYPEALRKLNLENNLSKDSIIDEMKKLNGMLEILGVLLTIAGMILIVPFVNLLMKQYVPSIVIYRILVLSVIANQLCYFVSVFLLSNNLQFKLVNLQVVTSLIAVAVQYAFIESKLGLFGVSIGTLIINIFYSLSQYFILCRILKIENYFKFIYSSIGKYIVFCAGSVIIFSKIQRLELVVLGVLLIFSFLYIREVKNLFLQMKNLNNKRRTGHDK